MSEETIATAADIRPCISSNVADPSGLTGVLFAMDLSGAPALGTINIPAGVKGMWIDMLAVGCDVKYAFVKDAATAPTLVFATFVAAGTGSNAAGARIFANERYPVKIPKDTKQIVYIWAAATTGGAFEAHVSSRRG